MAAPEQEAQVRKQLDAVLVELGQIGPDSLARPELGVELNFSAGVPYFQRTLKLFDDLRNVSLDGAPHPILNSLLSVATNALNQFKAIQTFSIAQHPQNTVQARDSLINQIRDYYDTVYPTLTPQIAYAIRRGTDFEGLEREARSALQEIRNAQTELHKTQKAYADEAQRIVESMRRAAAEVGVAQQAIYFKLEAEEHAKQSTRWLWATGILGGLTLALIVGLIAFYLYYPTAITGLTPSQAIQLGVAKLALISLLYFGIVFSARVFRAHRHNLTVNKHRQNALSTFETFVKAAREDQVKDAVLLYAAQSIFAPQATGFSGRESEPQSTPQIMEIIRGSLSKEGT